MRAALAGLLASTLVAPALTQSSALDEARFHELQELLTPNPDAVWRSIPWRIDLLAAQAEAAEQKRPLFVWAMDGHPLGCT